MRQKDFEELREAVEEGAEILRGGGHICELCSRTVPSVTKHHLIPQARHNKRVKRQFGDECKTRVAWLCVACHRQLHYLFTNHQLEREFNTLESLMANHDVAKYVGWIKDKPGDFVPTKGRRK